MRIFCEGLNLLHSFYQGQRPSWPNVGGGMAAGFGMSAGLRVGYKQTEVGVIPEDWAVSGLAQLADIRGGIAKNENVAVSDPVSVHYLRVANVQDGYLSLSEMSKIQLSRKDLARYTVLPGDVLMNEGGDLDKLGRGAIWRGEFNPCVHQNHVFVVRCKENLLPDYLNVWTATSAARRFFLLAGKQTTNLASISKSSLGHLLVAVPMPEEQRAIAAALSDVDALLGGLERLIAKKQGLKVAAIQQLLTGQTRLPGFSGEWEVKRLGDVADIDPDNLGSNTPNDYEFNYISLEDVDCGVLAGHSEQVFKIAPSRARRKLKLGDVLVSTVRPNLQSHLLFQIDAPHWICSTGFAVVRCRAGVTNPAYVFPHLFDSGVTRQIETLLTGSNYPAVNSKDVRALVIPIPPYAEQTAIASVLSDMDTELAALQARRSKTQALKLAMMQELLTGRIRLV